MSLEGKQFSHYRMKMIIALSCLIMLIFFILIEIYMYAITTRGYTSTSGYVLGIVDDCDCLGATSSLDLHPFDMQLVADYGRQMEADHAYTVSITLSSSKENVPLSALSGFTIDGQNVSLGTLLGDRNTPCVSASLIVDPAIFSVQPSQSQEYPLEQSKITWHWSITPLPVDLLSYQSIYVQILFSGKAHCGRSDTLTGPYVLDGVFIGGDLSAPLDRSFSLSILVMPPLYLSILLTTLALSLLTFLTRLTISLWQKRRKKGRRSVKVIEKEKHQVMAVENALNVFYCYAHEDKALRDQLERHLSPLHCSGQIINWYDGEIAPGTLWKDEIRMQLNSAHIILLLISPDFTASNHCMSQMTRALERHYTREASVIPIILRAVVWDTMPFADLQVLPSGGEPVSSWLNRDEAFRDVVRGIQLVVQTRFTIKIETS